MILPIDTSAVEQALQKVVAYNEENQSFSTGGRLEESNNLLIQLVIPELGELDIPITTKDINTLKSCGVQLQTSSPCGMCYKIDVSENYSEDTQAGIIFQNALASLLSLSLANLKCETQDIRLMKVRPKHLLIYENGSYYDTTQEKEIEPGTYAIMHLQIPVRTGYSGGSFEISRGKYSTIYDFSSESSHNYYFTCYYSDCSHRMQPISGGTKVILVSTLTWKHTRPVYAAIHDRDGCLVKIKQEITDALGNWRLGGEHYPRKFAIPLEHQYTVASLSFTYLQGRDQLIANLLRSIEFLDVHLAIDCRTVQDDLPKISNAENTRKRKKPHRYVEPTDTPLTLVDVEKENITEYWVSARTDTPFPFTNLTIEPHEIAKNGRKWNNGASGVVINKRPLLRRDCYYDAMLVIWPSQRTINFACRHGFLGALDILEYLLKETQREKLLFSLGEVVAFCCANPRLVWCHSSAKVGEVTNRLLRLCICLSSSEQGLIVLSLIAEDLPEDEERISRAFEGIPTKEVGDTVAQFIRLAGWDACSEFIYKIVSVQRLALQTEPLVRFVSSLLDYGLTQPAEEIAGRISTFVFNSFNVIHSNTNEAIGEMMFRLKELGGCTKLEKSYVKWLGKLDTQLLCELVIYLRRYLAALIKRVPGAKDFYFNICQILFDRRLDGEYLKVTNNPLLVDVLQCLVWARDVQLVRNFILQITRPTNGNNQTLEDLVTSNIVWKLCLTSMNGKRILTALVEARLNELITLKPPVFSWQMLEAAVPNEPELESFLRSSEVCATLSRTFDSMNEAVSWAMNVFGVSSARQTVDSDFFRDHKYSAKPTFQNVSGKFVCKVTKNRKFYERKLREFSAKIREKDCLITLYRNKLHDVKERSLTEIDLEQFYNKHVRFDLE